MMRSRRSNGYARGGYGGNGYGQNRSRRRRSPTQKKGSGIISAIAGLAVGYVVAQTGLLDNFLDPPQINNDKPTPPMA